MREDYCLILDTVKKRMRAGGRDAKGLRAVDGTRRTRGGPRSSHWRGAVRIPYARKRLNKSTGSGRTTVELFSADCSPCAAGPWIASSLASAQHEKSGRSALSSIARWAMLCKSVVVNRFYPS